MAIFKFNDKQDNAKRDHLAEIKKFHTEAIEPYLGKPKGCDLAAIKSLIKDVGFELPLAYEQYLIWMGDDKRGIFKGTDCFINSVAGNTEWIPELLKENKIEFKLPVHYLAFFSHQGYQVAWFTLPKSEDDPAIWSFNEGNDKMPKISGTFTQFILQQMEGLAPLLPTLYSRIT